jgi:hypothetical protein
MSNDNTYISDHRSLSREIQASSDSSTPTRIILRLNVQDFDSNGFSWFDYGTAIEARLNWSGRPIQDWREKKHNIFVEHFQQLEVKQKRFHVIVGLDSRSHEVENMNQVHHEIYEIKRINDGTLLVVDPQSKS